MKRIMIRNSCLRFIAVTAAAVIAVSCAGSADDAIDDASTQGEYGALNLSTLAVSQVVTESAATRAVDTDNFTLRIWDEENQPAGEWTLDELPSEITLKVGSYTLEVSSHEQTDDAEWETPWYVGSASFQIARNETTDIGEVVCKLSNIKVTVCYNEGLSELVADDAQVTITIGEGELVFGRYESRAGYFRCEGESCTMEVSLTATIEGVTDTITETITGVKAGEWQTVRFTCEETRAGRSYHIYAGEFLVGRITPGRELSL